MRHLIPATGHPIRLRIQLILTATALSITVLGIGAWATPTYVSMTMRREAVRNAQSKISQLTADLEAPLAFDDRPTMLIELQKLGLDTLSYAEIRRGPDVLAEISLDQKPPEGDVQGGNLVETRVEDDIIHAATRFRSVLDEEITVRAGFNLSRIQQAETVLRRSALAISVLLSFGLWLILLRVGARLIRPIEEMTAISDAIALGTPVLLPVPKTTTTDSDELHRLQVAFSRMVHELRDQNDELEEAHATLEVRVAEQTAELSEALKEAQAASLAKSRFLANMSHEIRTPMNGVLGMGRLLQETTLNPAQKDMVQTLQLTGQNLMQLLNQVLDLSKIEAGHIFFEQEPYAIRPMLSELMQLYRPTAADKGLDFTLDVADDVPTYLEGDTLRLRQVLSNLINNGLKFTQKGHVAVSVRHSDGQLHVDVADTGPGIPPQRQQAIFESFTQADTSTTRVHGGTGLGLNICMHLIERQGGSLGVRSTVGEGSTFWFVLPQPEAAPKDTAESAQKPMQPLSFTRPVLIVDDNPINLKVAQRMLENFGIEVHALSSGQQAITAAQDHEYLCILMDCQMPGIDGLEATRQIREMGNDTPIFALTASAFPEDRRACHEAGMNDMLTKPIMPEDLHTMLLSVHDHA